MPRTLKLLGLVFPSLLLLASCLSSPPERPEFQWDSYRVEAPAGVSVNDTIQVAIFFFDKDSKFILPDKVDFEWSAPGARSVKTHNGLFLTIAPDMPDSGYKVRLKASDGKGVFLDTTFSIPISPDLPIARIHSSDSAFTDSTFALSGAGSSPGDYGSIVQFEWSVGSLDDFQVGEANEVVKLPAQPDARFPVVLRVTDDDSLVDLDTLFLDVRRTWRFVRDLVPMLASGSRGVFSGGRMYIVNQDLLFGFFEKGNWNPIPLPSGGPVTSSYSAHITANPAGEVFVFFAGDEHHMAKYADGAWSGIPPTTRFNGTYEFKAGDSSLFYRSQNYLFRRNTGGTWDTVFDALSVGSDHYSYDWGLLENRPVVIYRNMDDQLMHVQMLEDTGWTVLGNTMPPSWFNSVACGRHIYLQMTYGLYVYEDGDWKRISSKDAKLLEVIRDTVYTVERTSAGAGAIRRFDGTHWTDLAPMVPYVQGHESDPTALGVDTSGGIHLLRGNWYWLYR